MSLSEDDVRAAAALVKIKLPAEQQARYAADLSRIIDVFEALAAADTEDVAPMAHPLDLTARLRDDAAVAVDNPRALQALAPNAEAGLYRVPKVIDG